MPRTRTLLSLALIPLLVFLLSCGGSDDDDGDSSSGGGDTPSATEATGSGSSDNNSSGSNDNNNDDDDPDAEEILANCPELLSLFGSLNPAAFATGGAGDDLNDLQTYLSEAADNAPDEIADDFQVLADAFGAFFSVLAEYDVDLSNPASFATLDAEAQVELQAALEAIGTIDVTTASENISQYFTENCS
jgi:hypothetical protein